MNKLLLAAGLAAALTAGLAGAASAQTVRLGSEGAYVPWNFIDENGELAGFDIDVGNAACERAGLDCEWVINDWDSIIPNLQAGNYDAILAGMSATEERAQTINFTNYYFPPEASRFAVRSGVTLDFENLSGARIGVQTNTMQADWAARNLAANNTIVGFATQDQFMADLAQGNVNTVLADSSFLNTAIADSGSTFVLDGPEVLIGGGVAIGLRKTDAQLLEQFNAAIEAMWADGTIDALIAEWFSANEAG